MTAQDMEPNTLISQGPAGADDTNSSNTANSTLTNPTSVQAVATELAREFSIEALSTPAIKDAQGQIQTVALQMDGIRNQLGQIQAEVPGLSEQTAALIAGAKALEQMFQQIDDLAILIESVAGSVDRMNNRVAEAEKDLSSTALKPLQAVLESLKMGPKGFLS
ncbi:hypothetical protein BGZ83_005810 [Gryganskiella cystojenkinii]|nr:hypothetical protein BGZ83_005810 [Gryganskiella cystojenkinii]